MWLWKMSSAVKILLVMLLITTLIGCHGFHRTKAIALPPQLQIISLESPNPYSPLVSTLKNYLNAMAIQTYISPHPANSRLIISNINYFHNNPNIITGGIGVIYYFTLSATVELVDANGKPILGPHKVGAIEKIILSANQVFIPGSDWVTKRELERELSIKIYYWLIHAANI